MSKKTVSPIDDFSSKKNNPLAKPHWPPPSFRSPPHTTKESYKPSDEKEPLSTKTKHSIIELALQLRDEQLQAKIVHYKADLETNSELDAITAEVVKELQELQRVASTKKNQLTPPSHFEERKRDLRLVLRSILSKLFTKDRVAAVFQRSLRNISKRFARVFFSSNLHERISSSPHEGKLIRHHEQANYHALMTVEPQIREQLESFRYENPEAHARANAELSRLIKDMRDRYLAKTTPELNELVVILINVLREFITQILPPNLEILADEVVEIAVSPSDLEDAEYKLSESAFPKFRLAFEQKFMEKLVSFAPDNLLANVRHDVNKFRVETIQLVAEPRIYSDICELICEGVYDHLYSEGFLDLPKTWRESTTTGVSQTSNF